MKARSIYTVAMSVALLGFNGPADAATRIQKSFGNWQVDCNETEKQKQCVLLSGLINKKKVLVFAWAVSPTKSGTGNRVTIRVPTGVSLADGVSVQFPGAEPAKINYLTCGPRNCISEIELSDPWVKALSTQPSMTVSYASAAGKPLKHEVNLKQFKEAYAFYTEQTAK
jgi:invasion protein IalB